MLKTWAELAETQIYDLLMICVVESFFTSCPQREFLGEVLCTLPCLPLLPL